MKENTKTYTHESYGQISLGRVSGGSRFLYGSNIKHDHTIRIEIHESEQDRHINKSWYHKRNKIVEIELSPTQFAELIMSSNNYDGVPCTILYKDKAYTTRPELKGTVEVFEDEFKERMKEISRGLVDYEKRVTNILESKGTVKVADKKEILNIFHSIRQEMKENIPFVYECFNEQMDKTIIEAKGAVEAFVEHKIRSIGLEHAGGEMIVDKRKPGATLEIDYTEVDENED